MKRDFSRLTFNPGKHCSGVLHQQGRVELDSDRIEDVFDRLNLLQMETVDIIGACGFPEPGSAFRIWENPDANAAPDDFLIGGGAGPRGRGYVQGILAQLEQGVSYHSQPDFPNAPEITMPADGGDLTAFVYLEVWQRLITYLEDDSIREIALGGPDTGARIKTIAQAKVQVLPPSDRPLNCPTAARLTPGDGHGLLTTLPPQDTQPPDPCRIPDPSTYTGRENHFYRVEIHSGGDVLGSGGAAFQIALAQDAAAEAVTLSLSSPLTADEAGAADRSGIVTIANNQGRSETVALASIGTSSQTITLARGLSGAFTTANASAVTGGVARFKWSADNASVGQRVTAVSADRKTLTLASLGRDQATALRQGDLVEITDDASELGPARGHSTSACS